MYWIFTVLDFCTLPHLELVSSFGKNWTINTSFLIYLIIKRLIVIPTVHRNLCKWRYVTFLLIIKNFKGIFYLTIFFFLFWNANQTTTSCTVRGILLRMDFILVLGTKIPLTAGAPSREAKHSKWGKEVYIYIYRFLKIEVLKLIKIFR